MAEAGAKVMRGDEFYVGYLAKAPAGVARHVRRAVLGLALLMVAGAVAVTIAQGPFGRGSWGNAPKKMTGVLKLAPYPLLLVGAGPGEGTRTVLLVNAGKCGLFSAGGYCGPVRDESGKDVVVQRRAALAPLDGRLVEVTGTVLERDGRVMVELSAAEASIAATGSDLPGGVPVDDGPASSVAVRGRIIDPKCYLGAMKPGDGKVHRACAIRCIAGGIPPVLLGEGGSAGRFYLLTGAQGEPLNDRVLGYVDDAVEVRGVLSTIGDMEVLAVASDGVVRVR